MIVALQIWHEDPKSVRLRLEEQEVNLNVSLYFCVIYLYLKPDFYSVPALFRAVLPKPVRYPV